MDDTKLVDLEAIEAAEVVKDLVETSVKRNLLEEIAYVRDDSKDAKIMKKRLKNAHTQIEIQPERENHLVLQKDHTNAKNAEKAGLLEVNLITNLKDIIAKQIEIQRKELHRSDDMMLHFSMSRESKNKQSL